MVIIEEGGFELETTVVIVGSGPGGAVLGKELKEKGIDAVILEEGDYVKAEDLPMDRNLRPLSALQRLYRNNGFTTAYGYPWKPSIPIPLGVGVGGSSLINSGTCLRTSPEVIKSWEEFGVKIDYEEIEKYYDKVERELNIHKISEDLLGGQSIILETARKMGLKADTLPRNERGCKGCGMCQYLCPENAKLAMHISYIPKFVEMGGKVFVRARVEKIMVDGGKAIGVEGRITTTGRRFKVFGKIVSLACGAIYTPFLLKKNRLATPQVGENLTIHPGIRVSALLDFEVESWKGVPQGYIIDEFKSKGIIMEGVSVPPIIGFFTLPKVGKEFVELIKNYGKILSIGVMVSDSSRGRVYAFGKEPFIFYNLSERDAEKFKIAIYEASKIFFELGAKRVFTHIAGVDEVKDPKEILNCRIRARYLDPMAFHPLGTARMGKDERKSAVSQNLEYHHIKNLFIVDGSIFPTPLGVNPQETIMAFSTRAAEYISNIL